MASQGTPWLNMFTVDSLFHPSTQSRDDIARSVDNNDASEWRTFEHTIDGTSPRSMPLPIVLLIVKTLRHCTISSGVPDSSLLVDDGDSTPLDQWRHDQQLSLSRIAP